MPVPKKTVTSPQIQAALTKFLEEQAVLFKCPIYVDNPPAGRFSKDGRPDLFIDFGPLHFRVEIKARGNEKPTDNQQDYQRRDGTHLFGRSFTMGGMEELEYFKLNFMNILCQLIADQSISLDQFGRHIGRTIMREPQGTFEVSPFIDASASVPPIGSFTLTPTHRFKLTGTGTAPMWDSKHVEPGTGDTEELDTSA